MTLPSTRRLLAENAELRRLLQSALDRNWWLIDKLADAQQRETEAYERGRRDAELEAELREMER